MRSTDWEGLAAGLVLAVVLGIVCVLARIAATEAPDPIRGECPLGMFYSSTADTCLPMEHP